MNIAGFGNLFACYPSSPAPLGCSAKPLILTPTATVEDYAPATETMVAHNHNKLEARLKSNGVAQRGR
jgi:hypothetical protein